mmetsp:Transcript_28886/g.87061  ORF Transcript_28886/g.87061 Transcript_28886/m.87061 type:complete len:395 (-) Transcript_28886:96-1280(-)
MPAASRLHRPLLRARSCAPSPESCANCGTPLDGTTEEDEGRPVGVCLGALGIPVVLRSNGRNMCPHGATRCLKLGEQQLQALRNGDIRALSCSLSRRSLQINEDRLLLSSSIRTHKADSNVAAGRRDRTAPARGSRQPASRALQDASQSTLLGRTRRPQGTGAEASHSYVSGLCFGGGGRGCSSASSWLSGDCDVGTAPRHLACSDLQEDDELAGMGHVARATRCEDAPQDDVSTTSSSAVAVVALRGRSPHQHVCLVEKRDGRLGFPKGVARLGETSPLQTALRKWREDTGLSADGLDGLGLDESCAIADAWGCRHLIAAWSSVELAGGAERVETWQVEAGPLNSDPVVRAYWMDVGLALAHSRLLRDRRELLLQAQKRLNCSLWLLPDPLAK